MSSINADDSKTPEVYDNLKWNGWGDEGVQMKLDDTNPFLVHHVDGKPIRNLIDFLHKEIHGSKGPKEVPPLSPSISLNDALKRLSPQILNEKFIHQLKGSLQAKQIRLDGKSRLLHIAGKNYRDLWRIRKGLVERAPDAVLLPYNHADCVVIMKLAHAHNVAVIPYGGGTTVTGGVEANPFETQRMVVSVDMRRMNKLLRIDKESNVAIFETGVLGPHLDEQLQRFGFMFGHDPDSYNYSTLGGWIGARGSGAMSNKYGDIEQMVIALKVATPTGVIETPLTSRTCGLDLNGLFIGSEGAFGIITEATVKIEPIPEKKLYEGFLFPTFESAFSAFRMCTTKGIHPCTMRLYDEDDFRMSMAMSTSSHNFIQTAVSRGMKAYLESFKGWDLRKLSLVVIGFEGTKDQVNFQRKEAASVFRQFSGFPIGKGAGQSWQEKKYDLPYIRDFALNVSHWADVFETSVLYSQAIPCWRAVKSAVRSVWAENGKTGWIGCHTAHQYKYGCCLYFTFASAQGDENDMKIFLQIKTRAMEEMLKFRGNLTHHHGIGYEHVPWMEQYYGKGSLALIHELKDKLDPKNICNPGKLIPPKRREDESEKSYKDRVQKEIMFDKLGVPGAVKSHL